MPFSEDQVVQVDQLYMPEGSKVFSVHDKSGKHEDHTNNCDRQCRPLVDRITKMEHEPLIWDWRFYFYIPAEGISQLYRYRSSNSFSLIYSVLFSP